MTTPDGRSGSKAPIGAGRSLGRGCSTQWSPQGSTYTPQPPRNWRRWTSFTVGGKDATRALADQAGVRAGMRVLDAGGGLAGPARMLAVEHGAHVTVADLTTDYLRAGALLTVRMGLAEQVQLCCGMRSTCPFPTVASISCGHRTAVCRSPIRSGSTVNSSASCTQRVAWRN